MDKISKATNSQEDNWISSFARNVYSQTGEDGILEKIFEIINNGNHQCVEFGAWDGKHLSNTYNLIKNHLWSGVLIEADRRKFKELLKTYSNNENVVCLNKLVSFDGENSLDNILKTTFLERDFDLLSIDIDGNDYHIWESLKLYEPKVVVIEFNPTIPPDIEFVQPKDQRISQGSSLLSLYKLGKRKGYELLCTTALNAFFVKKEFFDRFGIKNNHPHALFSNDKYLTRLFQLYDGTIIIDGCDKLLWHDLEIKSKKLQFLPKFFRIFPGNMSFTRKTLFRVWRKMMKILY